MPSRNTEAYFNELPKVEIGRSIQKIPFTHKTSFNVGDLIPFMVREVVPGSTHRVTTSIVARLQTLLNPIMDNVYLDTYHFFVPHRLVLDHWPEICGENKQGPWTRNKTNYQVPYLKYPYTVVEDDGVTSYVGGFDSGSIADYMGIPVNVNFYTMENVIDSKNFPSALPFRGYALIVNEFFRDQNLQQPIVVHTDDTIRRGVQNRTTAGPNQLWYVTDLELGGKPFKAARFHDYFSSCLPQPQKSPDISIFGGFANDGSVDPANSSWLGPFAPVMTKDARWLESSKVTPADQLTTLRGISRSSGSVDTDVRVGNSNPEGGGLFTDSSDNAYGFIPTNLYAGLNIPEATISSLRLAFQLQKYYEKSARGGTRYREYLREFFGVSNGDARMQIPEYLGGHRIPLSIHQVANTGKTESAALGDVGALSNTSDVHEDFVHSFTEHGYIISLMVARYDNTYSQGLERHWSRRDILDFYNPVFAHISEQPVFARELSLGLTAGPNSDPEPDRVFGYQEAWADYRMPVNRCSGMMRPEVENGLSSWHLGDDYEYAPFLSEEWIMTDLTNVDRVLAVTSQNADQVFADIFVNDVATLPMPLHSIPGLADHF